MNEKEKTLMIVLIVFLLIASFSSAGYLIYKNHFKKESDNENNTLKLEGYSKTINVEYNNEKHKVIIEHTNVKKDQNNKNYTDYNIYLDNILIAAKRAFQEINSEKNNPSEEIRTMKDVKVYTLDKKYLVIILPYQEINTSYNAYFYKHTQEIAQTMLISGTASFKDKNKNPIDILQTIESDESSIKYYDECTYKKANNKGKISYVALSFNGEISKKEVINTIDNVSITGKITNTSCN